MVSLWDRRTSSRRAGFYAALSRGGRLGPRRLVGVRWPGRRVRYLSGTSALAAARDGKTLYVANQDAGEVAWVELPSGRVSRRIKMPGRPTGVAVTPDGTKLIVTWASPRSTVAVFDAVSGNPIASIPAGHTAIGPAIAPDGKRLYVCNRFNNDVSVIDLAAYREVARVPAVREPIAAAVTPDGGMVVVANHIPLARTSQPFQGKVAAVLTLIDARTLKTAAVELPRGSTGLRGVCVAPDGKHAFVPHLLSNFESVPFRVEGGWINTNVISAIDLARRQVVCTLGMDAYDGAAGGPWDVTCTADGKSLCVSLSGIDELCILDRRQVLDPDSRLMTPTMGVWPIYPDLWYSPWRRIPLPGKGPRGVCTAGSKVYAAEFFSDAVAVIDLATADAKAGSIALGPAPRLTQRRWGQLLFHDATLCLEHWQSCASCHPDARMDGLSWDLLNDGEGNPKNTKSMLLAHRTPPAMSEGVRMTAEEAVRSGIKNILFSYRPEEEAAAIDAYLASLEPEPSPHLIDGRLSPAAQRGRALFQSDRTACSRCHPPPLYTDLHSHNVRSRSEVDHTDRFDTPTLIEVWRTAPYLHDGRYLTVKELLTEGRHGLRRDGKNGLSPGEIDDLVEFVMSL